MTATLVDGPRLRAPGDAAAFEDLDRFGYCLLEGALDPEGQPGRGGQPVEAPVGPLDARPAADDDGLPGGALATVSS